MSVRLGLAKVATLVAGTALIGGGAVHYAEKNSDKAPQYVKHPKAHPAPHTAQADPVAAHRHKSNLSGQAPAQQVAMVPMPTPGTPYAHVAPVGGQRPHGQPVPIGGSSGGTPVPAPPMLLLFGAAALALVARRRQGGLVA
jgi:hypothetical protein